MAIATVDWTITSTWQKLSTVGTTGDFILQNESQPSDKFARIGGGGSEAIRWAFSLIAPTCRGNLLYPGDSMARGTADGNVWAKTDSDTGEVKAQVTE